MSMSGYPYQVVAGPQSASYAGPTVNWSAPLQALAGQNQQRQKSPQLTAQYAQFLQNLLNRGGGSAMPQGYNPNVTGGLY